MSARILLPLAITDGDVYEVEIDGIGSVRNTFRAESL
jgi:2-keto-4-pentenoate hydratase/2-oxohepta-3-ene-1,7-dioic acid hydratase in catechol pathway